MSAPPVPDSTNLRALEAPTEVRLAESTAPAYVDISDGRTQRKPIVPPHLRDGDGLAGLWRGIKRHLHHRAVEHGHRTAYHSVRAPRYLLLMLGWAVVGFFRVCGRVLKWWHVTDLYLLEHQAAADGLLTDHLRLHRQGRETRTARGMMLGIALFFTITALVLALHFAPWLLLLMIGISIPIFARAGRPAGKPIVQSAVLPPAVLAPTQDVITRALGALGISGIDKWLREEKPLIFPSPVREDGPGWRAEVDLPFGVTAEMVIERRQQLASGLRRPLGAVWPEPVTHEHAGRLELWVGRQDVAKSRQAPWPLLKSGQADVFGTLPFGTDVRGRTVSAPVIYHNWLIGGIPGNGKTGAVRVLAAGCALDPLCELWIHELKGSGDLDPLEKVCHRFVSGINDESIGYAAESLRLLRRELEHRTERLKALREIAPDKKVTREIAARRSLQLWPVCCVIDEVQNLFFHERFGRPAGDDAQYIIKTGRAFGVFLILATQRPDKASLPTGISANVSQRFALKLMDQPTNDMILGTGSYKAGLKATTFRAGIDAGIGWQVGAGPAPLVARAFYLDVAATERVASRARVLREAAGTLSGAALGGVDDTPRDVLADLAAVFGASAALQWPEAAARLARRFPDRWAGATPEAVSAECRALGIASVNVKAAGMVARGCRLADVATTQDQP